MNVRIIREQIIDTYTIERRVTDTGATVDRPDAGAVVIPAPLHHLPKVASPYLSGLTQFCASLYGNTLDALVKDATLVDSGYLYAWRPVEEYGTGHGSGFSKKWELLTIGNALSNFWYEVSDGRKTWGRLRAPRRHRQHGRRHPPRPQRRPRLSVNLSLAAVRYTNPAARRLFTYLATVAVNPHEALACAPLTLLAVSAWYDDDQARALALRRACRLDPVCPPCSRPRSTCRSPRSSSRTSPEPDAPPADPTAHCLAFNGTIIESGTDSYRLAVTRARAERVEAT
jgi:hypothetical protein